MAKEIRLRRTFRFDVESEWTVDFIASGAIIVAPLLTEVTGLDDAAWTFELAGDRCRAMKVLLTL